VVRQKRAFAQEMGKYEKKVLLAYGGGSVKKSGVYDSIIAMLKDAGKEVVDFPGIMPNPTYAKVQEGAALVKEKQIDFILAVGGGSVIDCCKIISAQARTEKDIWEMEFTDYQYSTEFVPMGAVVTASGTGAEMNNGAVITNEEKKLKTGIWGAYADFVVLDPVYTLFVPIKQVISGAFDTLSHCMETYFGSPRMTNVSDEINEAIMRNVIRNLWLIVEDPKDMEARRELMWDSAMAENGILKLAKVTDFQAHMIEHQLGVYTNCNHGCGLAVIQPVLYRHICVRILDHYDSEKTYGLYVTLPGYEGLYFQGTGINLRSEDFAFEAQKYDENMIIVAPQLDDCGEHSSDKTIAVTEYFLSHYNIDKEQVYINGYSGGGYLFSRDPAVMGRLFGQQEGDDRG